MAPKRILITGASSGIGLATTKLALERGAKIWALGRKLAHLQELQLVYPKALVISAVDLAEESSLQSFLNSLKGAEPVDAFLHCAGLSPTMPFNRESSRSWQRTMQLNVYVALRMAQSLFKTHRSSLSSIVYISSVMAFLGEKAKSTYAMSKGALEAAARAQALEYAKYKIRVNTIAPAVINTPLTEQSVYRQSAEALQAVIDKHPLGLGEPEDVAEAALFLLSDAARWITGSSLRVDGGYSIM